MRNVAGPLQTHNLDRNHGGLVAVIGVLLLLAAAFAAGLAVLDTNSNIQTINRASLIGEQALRVSSILNEMEAAERGYVLTNDVRLLDSYRTATEDLQRAFVGLSALIEDERQRQRLDRVRTLTQLQIARGGRIVALARDGRSEAAVERLREDAGADPMAPVKSSLGNFIAGNDQLKAAAQAAYAAASRRQLIAAFAAAFSIVVFGLYQVMNAYRFMRHVDVSRARLHEANLGLEEQVAARTKELATTVMRFQVALRAANVVVYTQDRKRRFTWISRDIFGIPRDQVVGSREEDVFRQEVIDAIVPMKEAVLATGEPRGYDYGTIVDGDAKWFRSRAEPLRNDAGELIGIIGAVIDITSERIAQERTVVASHELSSTLKLLDVALRGAEIFVFTQDAQRRMTFVSHDFAGFSAKEMIGLREEEILSPETAAIVIAEKEHVLASGEVSVKDVPVLDEAGGQRWYKLRIEPLREDDRIVGVIGCAVDVTGEKEAERRLRSLTEELDSTVQRFQIALRGADITVFAQDRDLRFTWLSADVRGVPAQDFIGRSEDEMLPAELGPRMREFKQAALDTGEPQNGEFRYVLPEGERWYYIHVEAQRDESGSVVGLLGAAVDITERRQREVHNRVLLRELTHRTKNLLAVVQAMARQTLTASSSARDFEARFSGRLQGLARSLDILVDENWEGASVTELVRSQLGHYREVIGTRIKLEGPDLRLEPEAAQNIGLALHELSTNSAKYGALSVDEGKITIRWTLLSVEEGAQFRFDWIECDGPPVSKPDRKGFGHAVLERLVPRALNGRADLDHAVEGVHWRLDIPASHVRSLSEAPRPAKVWAG